jgi:hypothetical protein
MVKRKKSLSFIIALGCMIFFGILVDGYAQGNSNTPAGPVVQQQPTTRQPYTNSRMKRRGFVVIADLNVTPLMYTGSCPTIFTLKGQIYANKPMTVLYKIVRSDNMPMEPIAVDFEKEERKEITYTWEIGNSAKPAAFNEWALLEVVYPLNTKIRSNVAFVKGSCTNQADSKQQDVRGQQEGQKVQPTAPTGFPGPQPPGNGPAPIGLPMNPPGQQKQPTTDVFPMMPPGQGGQAPGSLPMPQPGQTGPMPGSAPMPPPDVKTLPGTGK